MHMKKNNSANVVCYTSNARKLRVRVFRVIAAFVLCAFRSKSAMLVPLLKTERRGRNRGIDNTSALSNESALLIVNRKGVMRAFERTRYGRCEQEETPVRSL